LLSECKHKALEQPTVGQNDSICYSIIRTEINIEINHDMSISVVLMAVPLDHHGEGWIWSDQ
ncbi:hypothetical protein ACJX0J_031453, partial [Zea mays]